MGRAPFLLLVVLLMSAATAAAQAPGDPERLLREFDRLYLAGQADAATALFTDDAVVDLGPNGTVVGKEAIRSALRRLIAGHPSRTMTALTASGNRAVARFDVQNDATRRAGVPRILYSETIEVRDGKIALHRTEFDISDPDTARFLAFLRSQGPAPGAGPNQLPRTGSPAASLWLVAVGLLGLGAPLAWAARRRAAVYRRKAGMTSLAKRSS